MRPLTPGEVELAREAFGEQLDYPPIRFLPSPWGSTSRGVLE